jgi:hypothetical protein
VGDAADDALEREMDRALDFFFEGRRRSRQRNAALHFSKDWSEWTTKEGETLKIAEMDHTHRRNSAALLLRRNGPEVMQHPLYRNLLVGLDDDHPKMQGL